MRTSLSPSVCRAFLGCQIEKAVDELNLSKKIISCHPSSLPLPDHLDLWLVKTKRRPVFSLKTLLSNEWKGAPRVRSSITRSSWKGVEELDSTARNGISPPLDDAAV